MMKRNSLAYNLINILVLLVAALIFFLNYNVRDIFAAVGFWHVIIIIFTAVLVHFFKAFRLYLALYGSGISASSYSKIYCKVTPVSILLPFKLGELFRMYCYGHQIGSMLKGIVTVLLDRFMDTIALVTMIIAMWLYSGEAIIPLVYLLVIFLIAAVLLFIVFPGLYSYWKKYLLRANATKRKLKVLSFLDKMNMVYAQIINVSKGRGIILYVLSLIAWSVEIGSVALLSGLSQGASAGGFGLSSGTGLSDKLSEYLMSALGGSQSIELKRFILISVVLLIVIYLLVKLGDVAAGKERK